MPQCGFLCIYHTWDWYISCIYFSRDWLLKSVLPHFPPISCPVFLVVLNWWLDWYKLNHSQNAFVLWRLRHFLVCSTTLSILALSLISLCFSFYGIQLPAASPSHMSIFQARESKLKRQYQRTSIYISHGCHVGTWGNFFSFCTLLLMYTSG